MRNGVFTAPTFVLAPLLGAACDNELVPNSDKRLHTPLGELFVFANSLQVLRHRIGCPARPLPKPAQLTAKKKRIDIYIDIKVQLPWC